MRITYFDSVKPVGFNQISDEVKITTVANHCKVKWAKAMPRGKMPVAVGPRRRAMLVREEYVEHLYSIIRTKWRGGQPIDHTESFRLKHIHLSTCQAIMFRCICIRSILKELFIGIMITAVLLPCPSEPRRYGEGLTYGCVSAIRQRGRQLWPIPSATESEGLCRERCRRLHKGGCRLYKAVQAP